jgi:ATP-dependent helicase YprA (DUF1998 family)
MQNIHPLETTNHLRETYKQYLRSLNVMNDPAMNALYAQQLEQEMLVNGPFLEGTLPFVSSSSVATLVRENVLAREFLKINQEVLPPERPIYAHQERAIRKVVNERRNLIVATGTGSGKTESFLIPLLDMLFKESPAQRKNPGVRALLLYPMNALANDQLKRLRSLLKFTPQISFGRFTGETETNNDKAIEQFRRENPDETPLLNERLSRDSMRENPPDILITNYAMLEYLLLRPEDTVFFDAPHNTHWSMIVLDEVHTYNGALGVELSMLLRRVKQRIGAQPGQLRCIGTSATIGSLNERADVARFAETLFGEPFAWDDDNPQLQDIVTGERQTVSGATWGEGSNALYDVLYAGLQRVKQQEPECTVIASVIAQLKTVAPVLDPAAYGTATTYGALLYEILIGDARTHRTQALLMHKAMDVATFAEQVAFDHTDAGDVVVRFIDLLLHAKRHSYEKPLLPSRYHVFIKALEGMFVCLNRQGHADGNRRVFLTRREICPECEKKVYEISRCTRCGAPYLSGLFDPEKGIHLPEINDMFPLDYLLIDNDIGETDEDDIVETPDLKVLSYYLCVDCGKPRGMDNTTPHDGVASTSACACGSHNAVLIHRREFKPARNGAEEPNKSSYCVNCGASGGGTSIILSAATGQDAPVGILTTALYQQIPGDATVEGRGDGRKLIVFADGRQDAAFFAPYLEKNYAAILQRRIILEAVMRIDATAPGEVRFDDVINSVRDSANTAFLFDDVKLSAIKKSTIVKQWLVREMIGIYKDVSLENQGMLEFRLARPQGFVIPSQLAMLGLTIDEAWDLIQILFRTVRQRRVMVFPDGVAHDHEEFQPGPQAPQYIRKQKSSKNVFAWLPGASSTNARVDITLNLLRVVKPELSTKAQAVAILAEIWDMATAQRSPMSGYLKSQNVAKEGVVFQLEYAIHELVPALQPRGFVCTKCRKHAYVQVRGVCTNKKCTGTMLPVQSTAESVTLYQRQYQSFIKTGMTVHEHSANLKSEEARDVQIKFTNGDINVLSCTTTFELGVDVGELQSVFLRNMPPSAANYIQRAGRAGRRDGATAMIVTYCQRRSHDLTYFENPVAMISGVIPAPRLQTDNTKITRRHLYAIVLAAFLRYWQTINPQPKWPRKSGVFFKREDTHADAINVVITELVDFISKKPVAINAAFRTVLSDQLYTEMGVELWEWLGEFAGEHTPQYLNSLWRAEQQLNQEFRAVEEPLSEIMTKGLNASNIDFGQIGRLKRMLKTLEDRELFGVLPNFGLMPKYGFPTDVVPLKTDHIPNDKASRVDLTRDLQIAIGEYAPGSKVVAAGLVWESAGIVIPGGRGLVAGKYIRCGECEYVTLTIGDTQAIQCRNCGSPSKNATASNYIVPEFGFIAKYDSGNPVVGGRPARGRASRLSFSGDTMSAHPREIHDEMLMASDIAVFFNRNVQLSAINEGAKSQGFHYCEWCGFASEKSIDKEHQSPLTGKKCTGRLIHRISLVHNFVTDALEIQLKRDSSMNLLAWRGVLYALLEGASRLLHIERDEIDGTVYKTGEDYIRLVIFDTVPGGAGFALQIADQVPNVLRAAHAHVSIECCGPETSCYRCLRTYGNQIYHPVLKRGNTLKKLTQIVEYS